MIPQFRATQLLMIRHAMDPNVDYKKLSFHIKNDVVLTYRILRGSSISAYTGFSMR
jgi:c-di-GMP-related signal transduction protein